MIATDSTDSGSPTGKNRLAVAHFLRGQCGASVVEYAFLLTLIVASCITTYLLVAFGIEGVFQRVALPSGLVAEAGKPRTAETPLVPVLAEEGVQLVGGAAGNRSTVSGSVLVYVSIMLWALLIAAGVVVWRVRKKRQFGQTLGVSPDDSESEAMPNVTQEGFIEKRQQIRRLLARSMEESGTLTLKVWQLMSTDLVVVGLSVSANEVVTRMKRLGIRHVFVCDRNRRLAGLIGVHDSSHRPSVTAQDIMTRKPVTVTPEFQVGPAITQMLASGLSCMPVINAAGEPCGILTTTDLMLTLQCLLQAITSPASEFASTAPALVSNCEICEKE